MILPSDRKNGYRLQLCGLIRTGEKRMKIIDCHCHVYPDKIALKATKGIFDFYDIVDFDPNNAFGTVADMKSKEAKAGICHQVIFSVATKVSQVESINNFIAGEVEKSGGAFTGLGTLHPESPTLYEDMEGIIRRGLKGVKLHPDVQKFKIDDYRCLKIFEFFEGKLPVLIHTGDIRFDFSNPNRIAPILDIYENLVVIGAHLGGWSMWKSAADILCKYPNFYVDCSSSLYALPPEEAAKIIREYGADRVVFGTDYPMWNPETELHRFFGLGLTEEENEKILHKNAEKLFDINL